MSKDFLQNGYNAQSHLLGDNYDGNGNMTNDGLNSYVYDVEGRPTTVNGVQIQYDGFNRAMAQNRSGTYTQILYSPTGQKFAMMSGGWANNGTFYVPMAAGVQAVYSISNTVNALAYYRHVDWLGSSRLASTAAGTVYFDRAFAPFGETYAEMGAADRSFTGQTQDVLAGSTGNYDFLFRQHSAAQGRWLVPDPAGLAAVDVANPQTWNRYAYVANNPLSNIDPSGLDCVFLNDAGNGIEEVDADTNTSPAQCTSSSVRGYYVPGQLTGYSTDSADPNNQITSLQYSPYQSNADFTGPQPQIGLSYINLDYSPMPLTGDQLGKLIAQNNNSGLPDSTIACIIGVESGGNPQAVPLQGSKLADGTPNPFKGLPYPGNTSKGLMQMNIGAAQQIINANVYSGPALTAAQIQADSFNPATSIQTGTDYIQYLVGRYGANWSSHYGPNEQSKCGNGGVH